MANLLAYDVGRARAGRKGCGKAGCNAQNQGLPREVLESLSLEILGSHLEMVLGNSRWPCLSRGTWTR